MTATQDRVTADSAPHRTRYAPWPIAAELSPEARQAWVALQLAVTAAGTAPPCQRAPELWWPGSGDVSAANEAAVHGCRACPALEACRTYVLAAGPLERYGTWGGLTAGERVAMRKAER